MPGYVILQCQWVGRAKAARRLLIRAPGVGDIQSGGRYVTGEPLAAAELLLLLLVRVCRFNLSSSSNIRSRFALRHPWQRDHFGITQLLAEQIREQLLSIIM